MRKLAENFGRDAVAALTELGQGTVLFAESLAWTATGAARKQPVRLAAVFAQAMEIVAILGGGGAPTSASAAPLSAPSSSSASNGSDLLDFLDSGTPLNLDVWNVPHIKVADSKAANFSFAPPPPSVSTPALFDPFDSDPFGPGTSSIDDLLASPATVVSPVPDLFGDMSSGQPVFQGQNQSQSLLNP